MKPLRRGKQEGHHGSVNDVSGFESGWRARFEHFGAAYRDEALVAGWSRNGLSTRISRFSALAGKVRGAWLDVGCGAGTYVRKLGSLGADPVCGIDYSVPSLSLAAELAGTGMWVAADGRRLPFGEGSWDGVICFGVTQALGESGDLVGELGRVTASGGQVWVDGLNRYGLPRLAERLLGRSSRVRYESPRRVARILRDSGCRKVRVHWVVILPGRLSRWQPLVERLRLHRWPFWGRWLAHAFIVQGYKRETG